MTTGQLWPAFYQGDGTRIRKWLYGSVLVRDWDSAGSTAFTTLTATDGTGIFTTDGNLNPKLLLPVSAGGFGFYDVGSITENGVEFDPKFSVDDTKIWQSRRSQRTDITEDDEDVMFSCAESTPLIDYLWYNLPIGFNGVPLYPSLGSSNYSVAAPFYTDVVNRQLLIIGVDGSVGTGGQPEYKIELRPRVTLAKKAKKQWGSKNVDVTELTFTCHIDPFSGYDKDTLRGGTVWLAEGGPVVLPSVTTITGTASGSPAHSANLVFNQPTSPNQPFTYTVTQSTGGAYTASTVGTVSTNSTTGVVTINVTGLTASSVYTFKVTATAANLTTATYPAPSGSVTAT